MRYSVALAVLALSGCASSDPNLYTLTAVPGIAAGGGPARVRVEDVSVAKYLDREHIVRSARDYQLNVETNEWWAEPLPNMLGRVLADDLAQRLPGSGVFTSRGAVSADTETRVEVDVTRLDADADGTVVLAARIGTTHPDGARSVTLMQPVGGADVRSELAGMSAAVGRLADEVAGMLRR